MKILFITPTLPYPPDAGGKIVIFNTIKYLAPRHDIYLLSLLQPGQERFISSLNPYCRAIEVVKNEIVYKKSELFINLFSAVPYTVKKFFLVEFKEKLQKLTRGSQFDLIQVEHLHMAQYIKWIEQKPVLLREHNVETTMMNRYLKYSKNWLEKTYSLLQWMKLKKYEPQICNFFDACLFFSKKDLNSLGSNFNKYYVVPCGIDTEYFKPKPHMEKENKLIFVGNFNFKPTLDGLIYFLKDIMPLLKKELPKLEIQIIGSYPEKKLKFWKSERNLLFTGYVEDVRPYIWESTVEVIPLRIASGVRLKILEGMALGKSMVSTSIGCEGLDVTDSQHLFIADKPNDFVEKTVELLKNPYLRKTFAQNCIELVHQQYDWLSIINKLEKIYKDLIE